MWSRSSLRYLKNPRPLVMAHRGNSAEVPENTLEAFQDAASMGGVDVIETDVHLTRDGKFVFFHDPKVDRTTDGKGKVADMTLAELKALDAGYRFQDASGGFPFRGKGHRIQAVDDILAAFPATRFNMDIKSKHEGAPRLLAETLASLGVEPGERSRVMVGSFWQGQLERFRQASAIPTSAGIKEVWQFRKQANKWAALHAKGKASEAITQDGIFGHALPYFALQIPEAIAILRVIKGPAFFTFSHALGIAVQVWTINDEPSMRRLLEWGADGIFTDVPAVLARVVAAMFP